MSTVLSPATAHLATTGPAGSTSTLEGVSRSERPETPGAIAPTRRGTGRDRDPGESSRWRDPFRSQRARHGPGAGFRWWHRLGAAVALLALIGALGVLLAALVGLLAFVGGVALEAIIG